MTTSVWTDQSDLSSVADRALSIAARSWFLVTVVGQWIFICYVVFFYGGTAIHGDLKAWNQILAHGYIPGDPMGNAVVAVHLFLAVVILIGGPLQLTPQVRRYVPSFHRWNGRVYTLAVFVTSIAGLYMIWSRGRKDVVQYLGTGLDAVLIMTFAFLAVRHAVKGNMRIHRRWALRLFMVVNAGWFFRIGVMEWVFLSQGNSDPKTFTGPFLTLLSFIDYVLPLALLEIYLQARERVGVNGRFALAAGIVVLTAAMGLGIIAAARLRWLPHMKTMVSSRPATIASGHSYRSSSAPRMTDRRQLAAFDGERSIAVLGNFAGQAEGAAR